MQRIIGPTVTLAASLAGLILLTSSLSAEVIKRGFEPTADAGWIRIHEGVYQKSDSDQTTHTYFTGIPGALHQLERLSERLRQVVEVTKSGEVPFYDGDALKLKTAVDDIMTFLQSSPMAKAERSGPLCNNALTWGLETSAINSNAYAYSYFEMNNPGANNATKNIYSFASLKYSTAGGSAGFDDSEYNFIPVGVFASIDAGAGVVGNGLPLLNLYAYASAWSNECGSFFEAMESNYNY